MILAELRNYLEQHGQASLRDMALHFDVEPEVLRGMLQRWIDKGVISRRGAPPTCGSACSQCDAAAMEWYLWGKDQAAPSPWPTITCQIKT
jgi:putative ferrous iron transport protein C